MRRQDHVKIELEEQREDASPGADKHESMIRDGGMPVVTSSTMTASAAAGATAAPCAFSPRRSKRKLEGGPSFQREPFPAILLFLF